MPTDHTDRTDGLVRSDHTYAILGACFEVYNTMGSGFTEPIYQECFEQELKLRKIPFEAQRAIPLCYKGMTLSHQFIPDLICYTDIIVELKAVRELCDEHRSQLINYLHASGFKLGLLVNFGHRDKVEHERFIH